MAGLASYVEDGIMSEQGIVHATEAIRSQIQRASFFRCKAVDIFATAFLRNCRNSQSVTQRLEASINCHIHILTAADEAHLGYVGAASGSELTSGVLTDIGGGSTELSHLASGIDGDNVSIPQGSLSSFTQQVHGILPTDDEIDAIATSFRKRLEEEYAYRQTQCQTLYGIGGSLRGIAKLVGEVRKESDRPSTLDSSDIARLIGLCRRDQATFAHLALKVIPDRIHTIVPGCLIAQELLSYFGASQIKLCKGGVREGYLIERMLNAVPKPNGR